MATFFAGSAACTGAGSMVGLLVGRSVQGAAAGGVVILVNICISDLYNVGKSSFLGTLTIDKIFPSR